jgi:DNA-binding IclR family transcriptional regulator
MTTVAPDSDQANGLPPQGSPAEAERTTDYMVGPVAAALDIMLQFEHGEAELRISDIARRLGLTRNKAFRLIKTLESRGFLQRVGDHYRVGTRLLTLGEQAAKPIEALQTAAQPELEALKAATDETVYLLAPVGNEAICVARIESSHYLRISVDVGHKRPLYAGAGQKMLLAGQDNDRLAQVLRDKGPAFTENTITDEDELRAQLEEIRQRGYSLSLGEVDSGAGAVAAPIYDYSGQMVAAIVIGGAMSRVADRLEAEWSGLVIAAARRISISLGHHPGR